MKWCQKFAASDAAALKAERESRQAKRAARREAKPSAIPTRTDRHVAIDAAGVRRLTIAEFARRIGRAASWVRMVIGKPMPELGNDVLDAVDVVFPASRGRRVGVAQIGLRESHAVTLKLKLPSTKVRNWGRRGLGGQFVKLPPAVAANDQPAPVAPPAPRQTTPALPRPKTKAGRRAYAKSKVDTYRLLWAGWERAKGAGVKQAQYCLDAGTTVAALRKAYAYLLSHGEIQTT